MLAVWTRGATEPTRCLAVLWNCPDSDVCFSTVGSSHATPAYSGAVHHLSLCRCPMTPARESPTGQVDTTHLAFYTGGSALGSSVRNPSTGTGQVPMRDFSFQGRLSQDDSQDPARACVNPPLILSCSFPLLLDPSPESFTGCVTRGSCITSSGTNLPCFEEEESWLTMKDGFGVLHKVNR